MVAGGCLLEIADKNPNQPSKSPNLGRISHADVIICTVKYENLDILSNQPIFYGIADQCRITTDLHLFKNTVTIGPDSSLA